MRLVLTLAIAMIWMNVFGQIEGSKHVIDCEVVTFNVVNQLSGKFERNELDSVDAIIADWIHSCSISECTQRLIVLKKILEDEESSFAIQTYFENELHRVYHYRVKDSEKINFGYIYSDIKAYYGYVPLNHPIDSIVKNRSIDLLKTERLTPDERLICILFSGDLEKFERELKSHEYNESFIKQYFLKNFRYNNDSWFAYTIYSGMFSPLSSNDVFTTSPMLGFTFSSPMRNKLIVELGVKFRLNINDASFDYYALEDTNNVNSDVSIFFGGLVSYKVYESEKLTLLPKAGIGLESVDTGLTEKSDDSDDVEDYNVKTIHLSLGLSAMTPILRKSYLGIGVNYHFCPYELDANLYTDFDPNLMSAELFWRF